MWWAAVLLAAEAATCPRDKILNPDWIYRPTPADIAWVFPPSARERGVSGRVVVRCELNVEGVPENCETAAEEPPGEGFAAAALKLTEKVRFSPQRVCGMRVRSKVRIPFTFSMADVVDPKTVVSPEALSLARRLMASIRAQETFDAKVQEAITAAAGVVEEDLDMAGRERAHEIARRLWAERRKEPFEAMTRAFALRMTPAQLREAIAFYESPAGQAMLSVEQTTELAVDDEMLFPELVSAFRAEFCDKVARCSTAFWGAPPGEPDAEPPEDEEPAAEGPP